MATRARVMAGIYARMGRRPEAVDLLRKIEKDGMPGDEYWLAGAYCALSDRDRAIAALERGVQTRSILPFILVDPKFDPLRSDSRFQELLRRASLPHS